MTLHAIAPLLGIAVLPGLLVGLALGLRGWVVAGAAPVLTFGVVGIAGPALPLVDVRWSPLVLAGATAALAAVAALARRLLRARLRPEPLAAEERVRWSTRGHLFVVAMLLVSGGIGLLVGWNATRGLTAMPQWWDAFWHMNAIQFIRETGQSAPGALQALNNPVAPGFFYPNGFHLLAATLCMLTGVSAVVAIDAVVTLLVGCVALGTAALVRAAGGRAALAGASALLACAFTGFPFDTIGWGPLLPYTTGLALIPGLLAVFVSLLRAGSANPVGLPGALAVGALGALGMHPSVLVAALVFGAAALVSFRREWGRRVAVGLAASAVVAGVLGAPSLLAAFGATGGPAVDWAASESGSAAVGDMLTFGHGQPYPQVWLAALCLVAVIRRRAVGPLLWYVVGGAAFAGLFVLAAAYEGSLVATLTRPWWNDKWRFAALWSMAAVVLAGAGLVDVADMLANAARRVTGSRLLAPLSLLLVVALVVVGTQGLYQQRNQDRLSDAFPADRSVGPEERRTFAYLATLVRPGERVMNDPYDGSAAMWALSGVRPLFASPTIEPHELVDMDPDRRTLWTSFQTIGTDPAVRAAAQRLGVRYVTVGDGFIAGDQHVAGLRDLDGSPGLELVHVDGPSRVYRITD